MSGGQLSSKYSSMQPLPVKAEREAESEAGEKALWALVNLGWLWLQETCQDRQKEEKDMRGELQYREESLVTAEVQRNQLFSPCEVLQLLSVSV